MKKAEIQTGYVSKQLLTLNIFVAIFYFSWWLTPSHVGNPILYYSLLFGEIYHVLMAFGFWYTVWPRKTKELLRMEKTKPSVSVFITVAGEPVDLVQRTAEAARDMNYGNHKVYILNDGFVAGKDNWKDIELMAAKIGVNCITRKRAGGAKAGNINNATLKTKSDFIAVLDADMIPHPDFLDKVMPHFADKNVGFVQTPQFYRNWTKNSITGGASEQQNFFFGPIMEGKGLLNSAFICGTNVVLRRGMLESIGGIYEKSIAEDFLTSLLVHKNKWRSVYVREVLCEGLAPEDLGAYCSQQYRWARGSLEALFKFNPIFLGGLPFSARIQYLLSALYYFNGVVVLIDIMASIFFLLFGIQAVSATTSSFALFFIPYMFLTLYTLFNVSGQGITFRAISFSQSSWVLQIKALLGAITRSRDGFTVTPKEEKEKNFVYLVYPHLIYVFLAFVSFTVAYMREGADPAVITNTAWAIFNVIMFIPFIAASYKWKKTFGIAKPLIVKPDVKIQ